VAPAFATFLDATGRNEVRSGAAAAGQQVLEELRHEDPMTMPTSGTSPIRIVTIDGREYEVQTTFCVVAAYCSWNSRHLFVEVNHGTDTVFTAETVFTRVR
jgi:hypothetical protein